MDEVRGEAAKGFALFDIRFFSFRKGRLSFWIVHEWSIPSFLCRPSLPAAAKFIVCRDAAGVDVESARAVFEDIGGNGAFEGLAGDDDRLDCGLEAGSISLPRGGFGGVGSEGLVNRLGYIHGLWEAAVACDEHLAVASGDDCA